MRLAGLVVEGLRVAGSAARKLQPVLSELIRPDVRSRRCCGPHVSHPSGGADRQRVVEPELLARRRSVLLGCPSAQHRGDDVTGQHRSALVRHELERMVEAPGMPDFAVGIVKGLLA